MTSADRNDHSRSDNVSDLLRSAATAFADRPALISANGRSSWAELDRAVDVGAGALRRAGLAAGDRVIVSLATGPDLIAALFAVVRAGLTAVPIGPDRVGLANIVQRVSATGAIAGQSDIPVDIAISPDQVGRWWTADDDVPGTSPTGGGEDIAVLARAASSERPVMVSHRAILAAVAAIVAAPRLRLRSDDRAIQVLPTYHLAGWITSFLPLSVVGGAAVIPDAPTSDIPWIDAVLATIRRERVTVVPGAPSLYRRLGAASGVERALASVRLMTSGAAPLDPGHSSAIKALTGQSVWEGYGISESSSVVSTSLMASAPRTGSVGLPVPGLRLRIVGDDGLDLYAEPAADPQGQQTPEVSDDPAADAAAGGEVGRIQIGGPTLFSGYWPDGSAGVDDDGWFTTGDLGYLDDLGELHLVDRTAETIRVAGFTVYPREIEDVLTTHPYVRDAAVVGTPGRAGDEVVAVLVPLWGTRPTAADLDEFLTPRLPVFKRPRRYQLVDRLPRNEIGRIDRDAVRVVFGQGSPAADVPAGERVPELVYADVGHAGLPRPVAADPPGARRPQTGLPDRPDPPDSAGPPVPPRALTPEPAAALDELGARLPRTGDRDRRGDDDTDDDLF